MAFIDLAFPVRSQPLQGQNPSNFVSVIPLTFLRPQILFSPPLAPVPPSSSYRRLSLAATMYSRLESYPVTTTHPADPQHQILHYPLAKSALLSQASIQVAYPRPTVFIPSSRSSSHSSGSSPEFS